MIPELKALAELAGVYIDDRIDSACLEEFARLVAADCARRQWQPMETAPKDGTNILLLNDKGNMATALWQGEGAMEGWWLRGNSGHRPDVFFNGHRAPTHWMPLPARPGEEYGVQGQSSITPESAAAIGQEAIAAYERNGLPKT